MYTLDISGYDRTGKAGITRYGGLFLTIDKAEAHGRMAARTDRFAFSPSTLWVRDEENQLCRVRTIGSTEVPAFAAQFYARPH